jgi:hypothetical protein
MSAEMYLDRARPKLTAVAVGYSNGDGFAALLDRATERSAPVKQIALKAEPEPVKTPEPHPPSELKGNFARLRRF